MNAQSSAAPSVSAEPIQTIPQSRKKTKNSAPFRKVKDARGHDIRGLWRRNDRFYAVIMVPGRANAVKVPLVDATGKNLTTVPQAVAALNGLRAKRDENALPPLTKTCTLREYIGQYKTWLDTNKPKSDGTIEKEKYTLDLWAERFGNVRLGDLQPRHIDEWVELRRDDVTSVGTLVTNRTINLDIIALNNCLNRARCIDKIISKLPTEHWKALDHTSPIRPLWTDAQIDLVCQKALEVSENGALLVDFIRFLQHSGSRRAAAFQVKWSNVDFNRGTVLFATDVKYGKPYRVDFNPQLEALLKHMHVRRQPDSEYLFPSPRRGNKDAPAITLKNSFDAAREAAGLPDMQFHDLRHYFISHCVMAGIDYMTIARWVNHKDGGILIGRVYGHLNDEHAKKQAAKLFAAPAPGAPPADPAALHDLLQQTLAQLAQFKNQKLATP